MDQDLTWWVHALFDGWQDRPGPRYRRLAAAVLDAVDDGRVTSGQRVPPERLLADGLGVSRGTVVACFDSLVEAGVVRRRQGTGTHIVGPPGWVRREPETPAATLLLRRLATRETIDLSVSVPAGTDHLPAVAVAPLHALRGHGLDPRGLIELRERLAHHLTTRLQLPTTPDQLLVTAGAQEALTLVCAVMKTPATVIAACPTYPGLAGAVGRGRLVALPDVGTAGVARAARAAAAPVIYVPSTGANPTGAVLPAGRRSELLEVARATAAVVVEDLALADLLLSGDDVPAPLAASHSNGDVIAVGSLSKLFWAGLRVGWVRASADTLDALTEMKVAMGLATSVPAQTIARDLLDAATDSWIGDLRSALRARRDRLRDHLEQRLPAWELPVGPDAGLSLWVRLPVQDAATFCATAARHGVVVAAGATMCACGRHHSYIRLSFAEPLAALDLGAERLATAWEAHAADLAATPSLKPASAVRRRAAC